MSESIDPPARTRILRERLGDAIAAILTTVAAVAVFIVFPPI